MYSSSSAPASSDVSSFASGPTLVPKSEDPGYRALPSPFPIDSPNELLKRVRLIDTFSWTTNLTTIKTYPIVKLLLAQLASICNLGLYRHLSYRSLGVRITSNTTSMYKGLMGVHFIPGDIMSTHWKSQPGLTQFQSMYVDASSSEVLEMELPWVFTYPKVTSALVGRPAGQLALYPHCPLRSDSNVGTDVSVVLTIEAWFNDPEMTDQVGTGGFDLPNDAATTDAVIAFPRIVCQGRTKLTPPTSLATESALKSEKGALTTVAETVSSISEVLTPIPIIGSIAAGVNVVSTALGKVFDWFGLSKPIATGTPSYVVNLDHPYSETFHGVTVAQPLSTNLVPYVATEPKLVCEKSDVMSILNIARTPSSIGTFNFPTSAVYGTKLFQVPVNPQEFFAGFGEQRFGSHLGYAASFFRAWTGDINYKFIFTSTKFQSTRIAIVWTPTPPVAYSQDFRQEKFDIVGTSTCDMIVPWVSKSPYRAMRTPNNADTDLSMSNGFISIWCLAPIVNNTAAVPSSIDCLVFSAGGVSLRFAKFRSPIISGVTSSPRLYSPVLAQGAFGATSMGVLGGVVDEDDVVSLREIAKRRTSLASWTANAANTFPLFSASSTNSLAYILRKFRYFRGSFIVGFFSPANGQSFIISRDASSAPESTQMRINSNVIQDGSVLVPYQDVEGATGTGAFFGDSTNYPSITAAPFLAQASVIHLTESMSDDLSCGLMHISPVLNGLLP